MRSSWRSPIMGSRRCWRVSPTASGTRPSPSTKRSSRRASRRPFRTSLWRTPISSAATPRFRRSRTSMPPVRISVAEGNSPDIYLSHTLKYATLVRTPATPQALDLLRTGQVDAFAGGRGPQVIAFIACCGGRLLPDNFLIANLAIVVPDTAQAHSSAGLQYIDEFVDWAKTSGLVQVAIDRANQGGTHVTPPLAPEPRIAFLQRHVARLVENGVLNDGQGNALAVKLQGALEKLADGEIAPAMNKLGAFINQIEAFRDGGILSDGRSASLLEIARDVVNRASDRLALAGGVP